MAMPGFDSLLSSSLAFGNSYVVRRLCTSGITSQEAQDEDRGEQATPRTRPAGLVLVRRGAPVPHALR
ncbi:hypothetical protein KCH_26340 [Kitasatospora cheerisanensis KCTC 2395]|uniref:Uncharacterized protein n=1 Tax=Kitasatospora cheerisanensis KCTC 2395 TaxID=1348663 RepID=A0A066YWL5_9ACTN|nr:hypothetical protein KCH_26340 [Kitasatospora cheerisanensis KCTC 2395]